MLVDKVDCCGCGLCKSECRFNAIEMIRDAEGFMYPRIDSSSCVLCGRCEKVCPALYSFCEESEELNCSYAGHLKSEELVLESSSGGVATAIATEVIKGGGIVFGVKYDNDCRGASFARVDSIKDISLLKGSKYIESDRASLFNNILSSINSERNVLVIGLPCDIAAIKSFVGNPLNLITCKLICRSNTSQKVLEDYIIDEEKKYEKEVKKIFLRYKERNQPIFPTKIKIVFIDDSEVIEDFTKTDFGKAFQILARPSCLNCKYKQLINLADLTLGDYQGINSTDKEYNKSGTSLILTHSSKGKKLLEKTAGLCIKETNYDQALSYNWMANSIIAESLFREQFSKNFIENGLHEACEIIRSENSKMLDEISLLLIESREQVAIWGAGDTTQYLFERLNMDRWNIKRIYDKSKMKIGKRFINWNVDSICDISKHEDIDVLLVMIPSENESELNDFLSKIGWNKKIIHAGKYKFYS